MLRKRYERTSSIDGSLERVKVGVYSTPKVLTARPMLLDEGGLKITSRHADAGVAAAT